MVRVVQRQEVSEAKDLRSNALIVSCNLEESKDTPGEEEEKARYL